MQSMVSFNKFAGDPEVTASRGETRQKYLENYLIHQERMEDAKNTTKVEKTIEDGHEKTITYEWMSEETMDRKKS